MKVARSDPERASHPAIATGRSSSKAFSSSITILELRGMNSRHRRGRGGRRRRRRSRRGRRRSKFGHRDRVRCRRRRRRCLRCRRRRRRHGRMDDTVTVVLK